MIGRGEKTKGYDAASLHDESIRGWLEAIVMNPSRPTKSQALARARGFDDGDFDDSDFGGSDGCRGFSAAPSALSAGRRLERVEPVRLVRRARQERRRTLGAL